MNLTSTIQAILSASKERRTIRVEELIEGNLILTGTIKIRQTVYNEGVEEATNCYYADVVYDITYDLDLIDEDGQSYDFDFDENEISKFIEYEG